ncbi:hypothetical protein [uncultured Lacinutrix sp.]|uniref:hypothetical protein n=1 Tax=uncultured Lacinutrix sp. TaxID=574032 RepID=UPI00260B80F8|nr:hypothetical protein [uncultured Lacinutrix sp.]
MQTIKDLRKNRTEDYVTNIWLAIMKMDTYELNLLLDNNNINYEDIDKEKFIDKLNETFNKHKTFGDREFYLDLDNCEGCNCNKPVCKFIGNHSNLHYALFFDIKKNQIIDIYHCN